MTPTSDADETFMRRALALAERSFDSQEVPVGAIIVDQGKVIGEGYNQPLSACDPTAHAEVIALRDAANNIGNYRLPGTTLYVTLEPCTMCLGALVHARVARVVFGAREPKAGVLSNCPEWATAKFFNHQIEFAGGVMEASSAQLLKRFFALRRNEIKSGKKG